MLFKLRSTHEVVADRSSVARRIRKVLASLSRQPGVSRNQRTLLQSYERRQPEHKLFDESFSSFPLKAQLVHIGAVPREGGKEASGQNLKITQ